MDVINQEQKENTAIKRFGILIGLIDSNSLNEHHLKIEKEKAGAPFETIYDGIITKFNAGELTRRDLVMAKNQAAIVTAKRKTLRKKLQSGKPKESKWQKIEKIIRRR